MTGTKFYFAEFSTQGTFFTLGDDFAGENDGESRLKSQFLNYLELNEPVVEDSDGDWYCGEYHVGDGYIVGEFGRQFDEESTIYDEDEGRFKESPEPVTEADLSQFILDIDNKLIVYNTGSRLGHNQFMTYFEKGFNNKTGAGIIEIGPLENSDSIDRVLSETRVTEADLDLEPTNPGPDQSFEDIDETIQEMLADKFGIDVESDDGLNVSQEFLSEALAMAQSEYGEYSLEYTDNGYPKIISSGDSKQVTKEEDAEINTITAVGGIASELLEYARSFNRDD